MATAAMARSANRRTSLMKVETHNHPTGDRAVPGRGDGLGRRDPRRRRDTAPARRPKAGLVGFTVSHLRVPALPQPWETDYGKPERIASALVDHAARGRSARRAFNNEFGRPNLAGYFRTFEQHVAGEVRGYHKPIMIAGGVGNIRAAHTHKRAARRRRAADPARRPWHADRHGRRCGVVDGDWARTPPTSTSIRSSAATRRSSGARRKSSTAAGNWASAIRSCRSTTSAPADCRMRLPELVHGGGAGGHLRPSRDPVARSPACRRAKSGATRRRSATCSRSRQPIASQRFRGDLRARALPVRRRRPRHTPSAASSSTIRTSDNAPVDVPLDVILGKPPKMTRDVARTSQRSAAAARSRRRHRRRTPRIECCSFPAVADKTFLVTIGDRTVGGLVLARPDGRARGRCRSPTSR